MSHKVVRLVLEASRQKFGNRMVLIVLAEHSDENGASWPKIPLTAREARMDPSYVRRCIKAIAASGELEVLPGAAPYGGTLYQIRIDRLRATASQHVTAKSDHVTPRSGTKDADDNVHIKEPSDESSVKPKLSISSAPTRFFFQKRTKTAPPTPMSQLVSEPKKGF